MLGSTHKKIAEKIAANLKLNERETRVLIKGSTLPDDWENFPHHKGKENEIISNISKARILFLDGDDECYNNLGIAFHYIQDRWTLSPRLRDKHTPWEIKVDSSAILETEKLTKAIKEILLPTKVEQSYLLLLNNLNSGIQSVHNNNLEIETSLKGLAKDVMTYALINRPSTLSDPQIDLNFAYIICNEIGCLVTLQDIGKKSEKARLLHSYEKMLVGPKSFPEALRLNFPDDYLPEDTPCILLEQIPPIYSSIVRWFNRVHNTNLWALPNRNSFGDLRLLTSLKRQKVHFRGDNVVTEEKDNINQTSYRLTIGMFNEHLFKEETLEPILLDFSSFFEAEWTKEALNCEHAFAKKFEEQDQGKKKFRVTSYYTFNDVERLVRIKLPVDRNLCAKFLEQYKIAKRDESVLLEKKRQIEQTGEIFWFDKIHLK